MKIRVTQIKSGIDRPERQKRTLIALGLRKLNAANEIEATPQILGMIKKVSHLVTVNEIVDSSTITPLVSEEKVVTSKSTKKAKEVVEESKAVPVIESVSEVSVVSELVELPTFESPTEEIAVTHDAQASDEEMN
jgi:large subunit ribosomal protein L30